MRKWDSVTTSELLTLIEYKKNSFEPELSRKIIELFHERMTDDEHIDPDALYALMKPVFALIMEGKTADQAFGLRAMKGKYNRPDTYDRDLQAAVIVILSLRNNSSWLDAINIACEKLDITESSVQRACEKFRAGLDSLPDNILQQIAAT